MRVANSATGVSTSDLYAMYRARHTELSSDNQLRLRRCLSWLEKAENEHLAEDFDTSFVFHWIVFNSMYATSETENQPSLFKVYLEKITRLDYNHSIRNALQPLFGPYISPLLRTRYVYGIYWKYDLDQDARNQTDAAWEEKRKNVTKTISAGLTPNGDINHALNCIFDLLYVLRNQLIHGLATYKGSVNRDQVRNGSMILARVVPCFAVLMLGYPDQDWGQSPYPPINR
ncbi:MAG: hypothetical protein F4X56_00380 [Gammaproteobacteria bacterium]|nr:hypothetical protein [Gammaproteobacteria bacterium]MYC24355.1 hypothetical protein [Gammaproteobacteria bacterium]